MADDGIHGPQEAARSLVQKGVDFAGDGVHALKALTEARLIRPIRPDKAARALWAVAQRGFTPAAGYSASARMYPNEPAVVDEIGTLTFAELDDRTNRLANALIDKGVKEGDGVAVMCRNHRYFVESIIALSKIGANALMLNTAHAGPQITEVVEREGPKSVIYDAEFAEVLEKVLDEEHPGFVAWTGDGEAHNATLEELIDAAHAGAPPVPSEEAKVTILTSGTTGTPKGASRGTPGVGAAVAILSRIPLRGRECVYIAPPLFHQWGFAFFQLGMLLSSTIVLRRKFDPEDTLRAVQDERVECLPMVPVMAQRIMDLDDDVRRRYDHSSLRTMPFSGSALSPHLAEQLLEEFGDVVYNLYGSTEVAWVAIATPADLHEAPGTSGYPPRGTTLRIYDTDKDEELPHGETGRIFVGNDELFEGYTGGGSKDMIDGLMATGDVGHLDQQGRLFVEGRDDDMIVSGGENVFPQEVEETLAKHDNVSDAAVIGVDDEKFGQRLKAFVVTSGDVDEDTLKEHVKSNLAGYKVPRDIEFIDELPRNAAGKVLKKDLGSADGDGSSEGDEDS